MGLKRGTFSREESETLCGYEEDRPIEEVIHDRVMDSLDPSMEISDEELLERIDGILAEEGRKRCISVDRRALLRKRLFDSFRRLDVLQELVEDESVTEIMVNGMDAVFVERNGEIFRWDRHFSSREKLNDVIQQMVSRVNRVVNTSSPIVDARLEDGSRVNVVLPPVAVDGPILTIRKFPKDPVTMDDLIGWRSISQEAAGFLAMLVRAGYNIFISGGTSSGKTTFLGALAGFIPAMERVITIEDSAELRLKQANLVRLESRNANLEGERAITIRDLIRTALRMRPDRLIVGEVRGPETLDMLQAMNTGHDGSLSTGHGNSPGDMLARLETMVLMGGELPLSAVRSQIGSAVDILVHLGRMRDGRRKVLSIVEVIGYEDEEIRWQPLYEYEHGSASEEKWKKCGSLINRRKWDAAGLSEL